MNHDPEHAHQDQAIKDLCQAFLLVKSPEEVFRFLKDLCTPQEIIDMAERWKVCQMLNQDNMSYREISTETGVSLATITRVARFLKNEPYRGYQLILKRTNKKRLKKE